MVHVNLSRGMKDAGDRPMVQLLSGITFLFVLYLFYTYIFYYMSHVIYLNDCSNYFFSKIVTLVTCLNTA